MNMHYILPAKRFHTVVLALLGLSWLCLQVRAEPTPGRYDKLITQSVVDSLHEIHLSRPEIGDELSRRMFRKFLKDIDPGKLYFVKSDYDEFKQYETELDDQLLQGDMRFAYIAYNRLLARMSERMKSVPNLIAQPQDFTVKEYFETDYDNIPFAKDENELQERWRKRIKFDLLLHRMGQKPLPDAEAKQKVRERYETIFKRYKQLDNYDLMELYLSDLTNSVDPHSTYMSPSTLDDFDISMRLQLEGIGALLRQENGQTIISEIVPGGAAAADGKLKVNDKIVAVAQGDGKFTDILDMKLRDAVRLIRGKRGTKVELRVVPAGKVEPVVYVLTRQKIELKDQAARAELIEQGKKTDGTPYRILVIDLPSFYADMSARPGTGGRSATEDVRKILKEFSGKMDGVVLDIRHNGGGSLLEARALTGLFIDQGPVVQVKGAKNSVRPLDDPEKGIVYGGPLIVLVSKLSASASEILAGALQDYGRALIVGDSATHGKGTVQVLLDLGDQLDARNPPKLGALKLTIQQFYRVNGDSTQNRGVASDLVIASLTDELATGEKELENAIPFDKVSPVNHDQLNLIPEEVKTTLRAKSAARIKASADFAKLSKEIEAVKARKARKAVPLNEQELKEQFSKEDAERVDQNAELPPEQPKDTLVYKFQRNFTNMEMLQIMEDFLAARPAAAVAR
jgi:carboxyl-terminal processing protease